MQREMKLIKKNIKINFSVLKKELRTAVSKPSYTLIKIKRITFFLKQRKFFKKEKYLDLNNFNNKNAITKTKFSSGNLAINTTQWYILQEDMKNCQNCKRKEIENNNIRRKALNDINEVIALIFKQETRQKLQFFFAEVFLGSFLQTVIGESL